jgi:hypothetical protein
VEADGELSGEASSRCVGEGGATTHISTIESSDEASSCHEGGGAVRRRLELPAPWCEDEGAVQLEGEANLP